MPQTNIMELFRGTSSQLTITFIASVSAISDGMQYGWTSPMIPILRTDATPIKIKESDEIWLEKVYLFGGLVGLPITIYLVNKIGRHKSIVVSSFTSLLAWILIGLANSVEFLYVARFMTGVAADVAFVATPMYVAEIADQKIRGFLSSFIYIMMLLGILLIYAIGPYVPFYASSVLGCLLLVMQLILMLFVPESPYYLISKDKFDEARWSLKRLRPPNADVEKELEDIDRAIVRMAKETGRLQDLVLVPAYRKAFLITIVLTSAQHFCGITVILMNVHSILSEAGSIYLEFNLTAIIYSVIMLLSAMIASIYVDKYGRKILLTSSCFLTGVSLLPLAIYFNLQKTGYDVQALSWIPLACVMSYGAVFKFGLGLLPVVISSELYSNKIKALGMSLVDAMYVGFGLLSIEFYQQLNSAFGIYVPFYCFAVVAFATGLFSACYLPETKGKTLDEIQTLLRGENDQRRIYQ